MKIDPNVIFTQYDCVKVRVEIANTEARLGKALRLNNRYSQDEVDEGLLLKAYLLGQQYPDLTNPFGVSNHRLADRLQSAFGNGQQSLKVSVA